MTPAPRPIDLVILIAFVVVLAMIIRAMSGFVP